MLASVYYKLSLFSAHAVTLFVLIYMNRNKLDNGFLLVRIYTNVNN